VIYIEARTSAGDDPDVNLEMCWDAGPGTPIDSGGCEDMNRFEDADQYMFHRDSNTWTDTPPSMVRVTSELGGSATLATSEWLPSEGEAPRNDPYDSDFITDYMNPTELYAAYVPVQDVRLKLHQELVADHPAVHPQLPGEWRAEIGRHRVAQIVIGASVRA
jgi:hypothetical protein